MAKPIVHARSAAKKWGGIPEDYIEIENLMDSSKAAIPSNVHRALTHNSWFIYTIIPRIFGDTITNSDGKVVSTTLIAETHTLEDFQGRFIPSAQDYLENMTLRPWMCNSLGGDVPNSFREINKEKVDPQDVVLDGARRHYDEFLKNKDLDLNPIPKDEYVVINPVEPNLDDLAPFIKFYPGVSD
jgi:hypothetical protein